MNADGQSRPHVRTHIFAMHGSGERSGSWIGSGCWAKGANRMTEAQANSLLAALNPIEPHLNHPAEAEQASQTPARPASADVPPRSFQGLVGGSVGQGWSPRGTRRLGAFDYPSPNMSNSLFRWGGRESGLGSGVAFRMPGGQEGQERK